jgi:hypothetical protein
MSKALLAERRVGDRRPIELVADLRETADISGLLARFYMHSMDRAAIPVVDAAIATKTDITAQERAAKRVDEDAPPQSVWMFSYQPTAADVDTPGHYLADFEVVYAGSQLRRYPPDDEWLRIVVMPR